MERVQQLDRTGCGLACVATLTGESYETVKQQAMRLPLYNGFGQQRNYRTDSPDLRKLVDVYSLQLGRVVWFNAQVFDQRMSLKDFAKHMTRLAKGRNAIVATHYQNNGNWHWIVWDGEKCCIHDPRDPPYKTVRPSFYMYVGCKSRMATVTS